MYIFTGFFFLLVIESDGPSGQRQYHTGISVCSHPNGVIFKLSPLQEVFLGEGSEDPMCLELFM